MDFGQLLAIIISAVFVNNYVLGRFLGLCPFVGVSKQVDSAVGMGIAVIFVMTIASIVTWPLYYLVLVPNGTEFLKTIVFILVIASLVQFVEMVIKKVSPALYDSLGVFLPLITTNCAILGVAVLNIDEGYSFIASVVNAFFAGVGFTLALVLMAGIREKLEFAPIPEALKGLPISFFTASLMALAFMGFSGFSI